MNFRVDPHIFEALPDLYIGVVAAKGICNSASYPVVDALLDQSVETAQQRFAGVNPKQAREIVPYREAFRMLGLNPNRFPCSVEAMVSRIAKGKGMPHINPLVDLNNALSLKYVIPMGTHDWGRSAEDIEMRYAIAGDTFVPFGETEAEAPGEGEVIYAVGHEVRTRRWTWRQSEYGKITPQTTDVFFPIDGFYNFNNKAVDAVRKELAEILEKQFSGTVMTGFVDKAHPFCHWEL